jgi:hypothetical protein
MVPLWRRNPYIVFGSILFLDNDDMPSDTESKLIGGTPRALLRPAHVKPPANWQMVPVPAPEPPVIVRASDQPGGRDPVRYGDWENKGLAIDF